MDQSPRVTSMVRTSTHEIKHWSSRVKRSLGVQVRSWHSPCALLAALKSQPPERGLSSNWAQICLTNGSLSRLSSEAKQVILSYCKKNNPRKTTHLTIQHVAQSLSPIFASQSYLTSELQLAAGGRCCRQSSFSSDHLGRARARSCRVSVGAKPSEGEPNRAQLGVAAVYSKALRVFPCAMASAKPSKSIQVVQFSSDLKASEAMRAELECSCSHAN